MVHLQLSELVEVAKKSSLRINLLESPYPSPSFNEIFVVHYSPLKKTLDIDSEIDRLIALKKSTCEVSE